MKYVNQRQRGICGDAYPVKCPFKCYVIHHTHHIGLERGKERGRKTVNEGEEGGEVEKGEEGEEGEKIREEGEEKRGGRGEERRERG